MNDLETSKGNRRFAEFIYRLVVEGQSPGRQAMAVGIGVFIGCIPLFGTHLPLVIVVASSLGLSRLRMYAATWISNPFLAPFLVWAEFQVGNFLLTGRFIDHSLESVKTTGVWALGQALALGTVAVGLVFGCIAAWVVWLWIPRGEEETRHRRVIEETAHLYLALGLGSWFRTRRLFYRNRALVEVVTSGTLNPGDRLTDLGCGNGEFLALLACGSPKVFPEKCTGFAPDPSSAAIARTVLPTSVRIEVRDPVVRPLDATNTVVVWNTKNRGAPPISERFVKTVRSSINRPGAFLVAWPNHGGPADAESVIRWLESEGFEVIRHSASKDWFRRQELILATA